VAAADLLPAFAGLSGFSASSVVRWAMFFYPVNHHFATEPRATSERRE
jgi:hypothetical protein